MSFKLTPEYLNTVLATVREGDMLSFLKFVDPDVEWRLGASDEPGKGHSGVYNVATIQEHVFPQMAHAFEPGAFKHPCQVVDATIIEDEVSAPMKNGQTYKNMQAIVMEFSAETGKIVKQRVYTDTEVLTAGKRAAGIQV